MCNRRYFIPLTVLCITLMSFFIFGLSSSPRSSGAMRQDVYVWQRQWTPGVEDSIQERVKYFDTLVVLGAEVSFSREGRLLAEVPVDYEKLKQAGCRRVGVALRIGGYPSLTGNETELTEWIRGVSKALIEKARSNQVEVAEFQIDYDCAESKLDEYRLWIGKLRDTIRPVPLIITALPSWLGRRAFAPLAAATDGYILQVHSLDRPANANAFVDLCSPRQAKTAVERAARIGKRFRVALPTYGYRMWFDKQGEFMGQAATRPPIGWPEGAVVREVHSNPVTIAALVQEWKIDRPAKMDGLIWYRLPVIGEELNWSWVTLSNVMTGLVPHSNVHVCVRKDGSGLLELEAANIGVADFHGPLKTTLRWVGARVVAADPLQGFLMADESNAMHFSSGMDFPSLKPGEVRKIGWVRLNRDLEATVETMWKNH